MILPMTRRRPIAVLFLSLATALALAACARFSDTPTTSPTPRHTHAAQAAVPSVRVPVTCDALFNTASATAIVGHSVVEMMNEKTPPTDTASALERQRGILDCSWLSGEESTDGDAVMLQVVIAPDAAAGYDSNVAAIYQSPPDAENTAGDASEYSCDPDNGCGADMKVDGYWVSLTWYNSLATVVPSVTAMGASTQLALTTIAAAVKGTNPSAAWKPPVAVLPDFCDAATSTAAVESAFSSTNVAEYSEPPSPQSASDYSATNDDFEDCTWSPVVSGANAIVVHVSIIRGGAWALPEIAKSPPDSGDAPYVPMTVPGATQAFESCAAVNSACTVELNADGNLVEISTDDDPASAAGIAPLLKAITAG